MKRLAIAISAGLVLMAGGDLFAQETAKVQVTIKVPAKVASFTHHRLVIMLYHDHPTQADRGKTGVDRHVDQVFSHKNGQDTVLTLDLGDRAKVNRKVQYSVTAALFNATGKSTHVGDKDGQRGPCNVLTNGAPNRVLLIVRPLD